METWQMLKELIEDKEGQYVCDGSDHRLVKCRYDNESIIFSTSTDDCEISIPVDAIWEKIVWSAIPLQEIQPIREVFMKSKLD